MAKGGVLNAARIERKRTGPKRGASHATTVSLNNSRCAPTMSKLFAKAVVTMSSLRYLRAAVRVSNRLSVSHSQQIWQCADIATRRRMLTAQAGWPSSTPWHHDTCPPGPQLEHSEYAQQTQHSKHRGALQVKVDTGLVEVSAKGYAYAIHTARGCKCTRACTQAAVRPQSYFTAP